MSTKSVSRSLSPSSPPFIFPQSPPSRADSTSTETLASTYVNTGSSSSESERQLVTSKAVGAEREKAKTLASSIPTATAKSFGAGWKSSSSLKSHDSPLSQGGGIQAFLPIPANGGTFGTTIGSRSRSPSLPILPSSTSVYRGNPSLAAQGPTLAPINTQSLPHDFELHTPCSPSSGGGYFASHPISPNEDTPHTHPLRHHPSMSSIEIELDDHSLPYSQTDIYGSISPINHHTSVPNLPFVQNAMYRKPSGLRFEYEDDDTPIQYDSELGMKRGLRRMPAFNFGQMGARSKLMSTKSMPVIPMMGEGRNVFIHRVNEDLSEDGLKAYASDFGDVISVKIPPRTTRPHAFVMFKRPEQAQNFIAHLKMRNIECEFGKEDYQVQNKALEDPNSANMYISGLPTTLTFDELSDLLAPNKICSWKPLVDEAGNRRGPIMARLQTRVQANDVIHKINGKYYQGMSERIQARIADSDEQKQFKRHQSFSRDRPIPVEPIIRSEFPDEDANDIELLQTREFLASQLEAINNKLSRTQTRPTKDSSLPNRNGYETDIIGPSPVSVGQVPSWATGHRHTSSNYSIDPFGSWPDWTGTWGHQAQSATVYDNHVQPRQQSLSLSDQGHPNFKAGTFPPNTLHLVKSSPELGGNYDSTTKLWWKDNA
ncbi:uncharacterized protein I206_101879 [Kwoniella pini CBS 10737]|uniref:RRM domain-containing protein n=1 Tax=Kwoniella pini CBS 10737 TaxID=1296096 RepID=A0AAJ8L2H0_9TREE